MQLNQSPLIMCSCIDRYIHANRVFLYLIYEQYFLLEVVVVQLRCAAKRLVAVVQLCCAAKRLVEVVVQLCCAAKRLVVVVQLRCAAKRLVVVVEVVVH